VSPDSLSKMVNVERRSLVFSSDANLRTGYVLPAKKTRMHDVRRAGPALPMSQVTVFRSPRVIARQMPLIALLKLVPASIASVSLPPVKFRLNAGRVRVALFGMIRLLLAWRRLR